MYKDLDKKRAADRERQRRHRAKDVTPRHALGEWAMLRGESVTPSVTPRPAVKVVIEKRESKPVPDWRAAKDAQMARFLKGVK